MATVAALLGRKGREVFRVRPDATMAEVAAQLRGHGVGALLVSDVVAGALVTADVLGIVSERDFVDAHVGPAGPSTALHAATLELQWATLDTTIAELAGLMTEHRIRHLPVRDGDTVVGVVSIGDAVAWHLAELETTAAGLVEYVTTGRG